MEPKPTKPGINRKDVEVVISYVAELVCQNVAMRRAGKTRSIRQTWQAQYDLLLPKIEERLSGPFHDLHLYLRDRDLPGLFRTLREVLDRYSEDTLLVHRPNGKSGSAGGSEPSCR